MKNRVCVHLVGEQKIPVYLVAINVEASKHILICTKKTKIHAKDISRMLSKKGCDCEIDEITNPLDISKISDEYIEIFRRRNLSDAGEVVFNITSGTKPMFLALFGCTKDLNRNYVYLDTVDKQLIYLNDIKYPQKITNLLRVEDFFGLSGYSIAAQDVVEPCNYTVRVKHLDDIFAAYSSFKNYKADNFPRREFESVLEIYKLNFAQLFGEKSKCENVIRRYLYGAWFEEYLYTLLKKEKAKSGIVDIHTGVKICKRGANGTLHDEQEFDVVYTDGVSLIVVECKCLNGGGDQTDITKLENLTEKFGGTFAKGVYATPNLISVSARSKIINSRAVVGVCGKKAIKKLIAKPFELNPRTIYESVQ